MSTPAAKKKLTIISSVRRSTQNKKSGYSFSATPFKCEAISTISPSLSSSNIIPVDKSSSPISATFSTSKCVRFVSPEKQTELTRRSTFETDASITDISILKSLSERPSGPCSQRKSTPYRKSSKSDSCVLPLCKFTDDDSEVKLADKTETIGINEVTADKRNRSKIGVLDDIDPEKYLNNSTASLIKNKRKCWDTTLLHKSKNESFLNHSSPSLDLENISPPMNLPPKKTSNSRSKVKKNDCTESPAAPLFSSTPFLKRSHTSKNNDIEKKVKIFKSKIPNFGAIHQRNLQKMESIKEYHERKTKRAELLCSGKTDKPPNGSKVKSRIEVKKVKDSKATSLPKRKSLENQRNGISKLGFKVGIDAIQYVTKDEEVKAVATKSKVGATTVVTRRDETQKYRTNRRFELLMKMRCQSK